MAIESSASPNIVKVKPIFGRSEVSMSMTSEGLVNTGADPKIKSSASLIHKEKSRNIGPVVEKKIQFSYVDQFGREPSKSVAHYAEMWHAYNKAGMNVVRWMRKTESDTILMPDLTADGSALYGKAAQRMLNESELYQLDVRKLSALDALFLELTNDQNFRRIIEKARQLMKVAINNDIFLPYDEDAFELYLHPEDTLNSWEIITLDLALSHVGDPTNPDIEQRNKEMTAYFLADLQQIRASLLQDNKQSIWQIRSNVYKKVLPLL